MPKKVIALCMNTEYRLVNTCYQFKESGCLGVQPKAGGKFLLKLNNGERPIANKYREGKMQRTLKRELKVLEIVKREAIGSSACCLSTHLLFGCWGGCKEWSEMVTFAPFTGIQTVRHFGGTMNHYQWTEWEKSMKEVICFQTPVWLRVLNFVRIPFGFHWGNLWLETGAFLAE